MSGFRPGQVVAGRFAIEGPAVAEGLVGAIWPAHDEIADRPVALKVVHAHLTGDPAAVARFQSEAGAASRLRHPHLLVVHGLWSHEGRWVLAEERLDGRGLEAGGVTPLATGSTVAIGLQLAEALRALHGAGHVHGDVRPGHVFLADRGAVLLGFGQAGGRPTARPGQTAPEVAAGGAPGVAADLYGLGVTLHFALTGRAPFRGESPWAVLGAQAKAPPDLPPGPAGLAALLVDLMHPDPDRRPPSVAMVRWALRRLQEDPHTVVRWRRRIAPVGLGRVWVVHGTDPDTGGPAVVHTGLSRRQAHAVTERLVAQGWAVRADRTSLTGRDLAWIAAGGVAAGVIVPVVGAPFGVLGAAWWRSRDVRPNLARALPRVVAPVPPRVVSSGTEYALVAGILLLLGAVLLAIEPMAALVPAALFAGLVVMFLTWRRRDTAADVLRSRLRGAFAEVRMALERRVLPLDDLLALQGEVEGIEGAWRAGKVGDSEALVRAEALLVRVGDRPPRPEASGEGVRTALARARSELDPHDNRSS